MRQTLRRLSVVMSHCPPKCGGKLLQLLSACHQNLKLIELDLSLRIGADCPAQIEDGETVSNSEGVPHIVRDKDNAVASRTQLVDISKHHRGLRDAESGRRFVKN